MGILKKINFFYGKYLYKIIPLFTLIIAVFEVLYEIKNGDVIHILANIFMGFVSLSFFGFYLKSNKQRVDYCLIELYLFFYTVFLSMDNHIHFNDIAWIVFLPCAIFIAVFIVFLNRKHR